MRIELPDPTEIAAAVARWRRDDPRFGALLERYGDAPRALRHYGLILWDQGDPQTAAQAFTGAVALVPSDFRLWTDLAGALSAAGQLQQAAACMEESLGRNDRQADGWLRLGSIRSALNDVAGAEAALQTALAIDSGSSDARLSLGLLLFQAKRFEPAAAHLLAVLRASPETGANAAVQACYGQALSHLGDFAGAADALRTASDLEPDNTVIALKRAQAQFIASLIEGASVTVATAACLADPVVTPPEFDKIARNGFHLLSAFDHIAAAVRLGEARLAAAPADPEQIYLLAVIRGEALRRAPDHYVRSFFDQFAAEFDKQLVGVLGYTAFEQLATMVETSGVALHRVLDLGCGTGLAGPLLARAGRHLTGVDLSPAMTEKARERGCYDALAAAEAVAFLNAADDAAFDLVFAADVLIYVGDLVALMAAVVRALAPGGMFAFTIETSETADLALLPSGRFAHRLAHVLALAEDAAMTVLATETIMLRFETHGFVSGDLILLQRAA